MSRLLIAKPVIEVDAEDEPRTSVPAAQTAPNVGLGVVTSRSNTG
jgi:hypothetical protein